MFSLFGCTLNDGGNIVQFMAGASDFSLLQSIQISYGVHLVFFPLGWSDWSVKLTPQLHLIVKVRNWWMYAFNPSDAILACRGNRVRF